MRVVMLTGLFLSACVLGLLAQAGTGTLNIYYIDTEGGQSTLFVGPTGESLLVDTGNAGDRLGAGRLAAARGMSGGEIIVRGNAGAEIGAKMRRGTVIVAGNAGPRAGIGVIAGNVIVFGSAGEDPGRFNKRGTIVVCGGVTVAPTYRYDCTYRPPHLAVTMVHLKSRRKFAIDDDVSTARFRRYTGDMAELGRGEILARTDER